jgi:small subunit ribosomal protein S36
VTDDQPTDEQNGNYATSPETTRRAAVTSTPATSPPAPGNGQAAPEAAATPVRSRLPRIVWWVVALHVTVLGAYSILIPTYRAPDEPLHVDLAHHWSTTFNYPAWNKGNTSDGIINSLFLVRFPSRAAHLTAAEARPKDDRPSYEELDEKPSQGGINQLTQHPPLYYVIAGTAERATELVIGNPNFQLETWLYRLVSIAMVATLPILIWKSSGVINVPGVVALTAMLVPLAIPQYLHIGASVNNDNLQYLAIWSLTPLALQVGRGDLARRTMLIAGVVTGIGLYSKGFSLVLPLWMGCALALALLRGGRAALPRVLRAGLIYSVPTMLIGGWWWVRNVVVYGALLPSRYSDIVRPVPGDRVGIVEFVRVWITTTLRRTWGDFGYFDTHIPSTVVTVATTVVVVALVVALVGRDRVAGTRLGDRLLLLAPLVLLMAMQFQTAYSGYRRIGQFAGLQGRYWFGALCPIVILIALGAAKLVRSYQRWLPLGVLVAAAVMQLFALDTIFGFYWGAPGSALTARLRALVAWAPLPGELIGLATIAGAIVGIAAVVKVGAFALRAPGGGAGIEPPGPGSPAPARSTPTVAQS